MPQTLAAITLLVRDYDEARRFYVEALGFDLVEDSPLSETKRRLRVAPPGSATCLLLAKAADAAQAAAVGVQAGGRVFLFLETDDFDRDHARYLAAGVIFREPPRQESYGKVAVFEDLYGNPWDLIERRREG